MKHLKYLYIILLALFFIDGCGGAYVNPKYSFDIEEAPRLAIAPVLPEEDPIAAFVDSFFVVIFEDTARPDLLIAPSHIRDLMEDDNTVAGILSVMHGADYTKEEMKNGASILGKTGVDELGRIREACGGADLCLVPRAWSVSSAAGHTFGQCTFRLYDMHTGQMIYEKSDDLNVNVGGGIGERLISGHLISIVRDYYAKMMEN